MSRGRVLRDWALTAAWLPAAVVQGRRLRQTIPVLPEATGPRAGVLGTGPALRLALIGDSTIAGVGLERMDESVSVQLAHRLAADRTVHWAAAARSGATAAVLAMDLVPLLPADSADVIIVSVGVNDVLRGSSHRVFRTHVATLVEAVRDRVGPAPVILSGMPPLGVFPLLPRAARTVAGIRGRTLDDALACVAVDLDGVVHLPLSFETVEAQFADDGFHPGPLAHQGWAEQLFPLVRQLSVG